MQLDKPKSAGVYATIGAHGKMSEVGGQPQSSIDGGDVNTWKKAA